jgi:predicted ATPase
MSIDHGTGLPNSTSLAILHSHTDMVMSVAFSADGRLLASASSDGTIRLWDTSTQLEADRQPPNCLAILRDHTAVVYKVALSVDGRLLASSSFDRSVRLWDTLAILDPDTPSPASLALLEDHTSAVWSIALSPDGRRLAIGDADGALQLWDVASRTSLAILKGHTSAVWGVALSMDGLLASGSTDGTLRLWDGVTGAPLRILRPERPYERMNIAGLTGITEAQRASLLALGAVDEPGEQQGVADDRAQSLIAQPDTSGQRPPAHGDQRAPIGLPFQPTPFIGRDAELAEIARILGEPACRLLTLLGPGGIGKTRLAIEAVTQQAGAFADGVAFVALASVGTPSQIVSAIGDTLGLAFAGQADPTAHLLGSLRDRHMLLVLDNFEHLLAGADLIYDILAQAPRVGMLVTSRERLSLQAEWLFDVEGLAYPPEAPRGPARPQPDSASYSAIQLFVQRATQVLPGLPLTDETLATIVRICRHVAGIPLAIELAAAGVRGLALDELEQQIRANLDTLATGMRDVPARHRGMRVVFDHSWSRLAEAERTLLSRLGVFRGGCTAAAAEQVVGARLPALMALVGKSLVRYDKAEANPGAADASRFVLLEPIREYALEQLAARGEVAALQRAHASYYLALAEAVAAAWDSPAAEAAIGQLDREYDNMRAALQWARDGGERTIGLQLGAALRRFWQRRGYYSEGRVWLDELLALDDDSSDGTAVTARLQALDTAAWLASDQHDFARAAQLSQQSMALRRQLGETEGEPHMLLNAARQARAAGQYQRALALFEEALARQRAVGDRGSASAGGLGQSLYDLALVRREQGDFARAAALLQEGIELHRAIGEREGIAVGLLGLGDLARDQGDAPQLRAYTQQSLAISRELGIQWAIGFALNNLALADYMEGDLAGALARAGESVALFRSFQAEGSVGEVLITVGQITRAQGHAAQAYEVFVEALRLALALGPRLIVPAALEGLGGLAAQAGQAELSGRLLGVAAVLRAQMGTPMRPVDRAAVEHALATARAALGADAFAAAWASAAELPLDQLLDIAGSGVLNQPK